MISTNSTGTPRNAPDLVNGAGRDAGSAADLTNGGIGVVALSTEPGLTHGCDATKTRDARLLDGTDRTGVPMTGPQSGEPLEDTPRHIPESGPPR